MRCPGTRIADECQAEHDRYYDYDAQLTQWAERYTDELMTGSDYGELAFALTEQMDPVLAAAIIRVANLRHEPPLWEAETIDAMRSLRRHTHAAVYEYAKSIAEWGLKRDLGDT